MVIRKYNRQVKILGAGISGLVAGIVLSKHGYKVEIFEKRSRIGSFFKKTIHSFRNYLYGYDVIDKYKQLGVNISNVYPIYKEFRFTPSMKIIEIYSKNKPLFYNFIRGYEKKESFDVELYKTAKKNGVRFYFNQTTKIEDVDVVACGASLAKIVGYGEYYSGITNINPNTIYIFFDNRYSSHGYSCVLPFNNEAAVILVSTKIENKIDLKKRFYLLKNNNAVIKKIIKNAKLENEIFGYSYYDDFQSAIKNKKLYVGEAAGFMDAATGFGTYYAVLSGCFAAKAIIEDKNYDVLWKQYFEKELKIQYLKRKEIQKFTNQNYENKIDNLIKNYGSKISSTKYRILHT